MTRMALIHLQQPHQCAKRANSLLCQKAHSQRLPVRQRQMQNTSGFVRGPMPSLADVAVPVNVPTGPKKSVVPLSKGDCAVPRRCPQNQGAFVVDMTEADSHDDIDDDWGLDVGVVDLVDTNDEDENVVDALQKNLEVDVPVVRR